MSIFSLSNHSETFLAMFYVALLSALIAIILSGWLIRKHITNFNNPPIQSKIIGILWMIPIYSFNSIISLLFPSAAVYIDMMRDCYEAYVLYLFFSLLLSFLCGGNESYMIEYLETLPASKHPFPFNLCITSSLPTGSDYLRYAKFGTLQYCVLRPLMALFVFLFTFIGWYEEGNFNPFDGTYFYIAMTLNVSIAFAFSSLLSFYYTFKYDLRPLEPVPKFLVIKSIIFCIFWQGLILALLVEANIIPVPSGSEYTKRTLTATLQDFIVCLEMTIAAIVNIYAFDYQPYADHSSQIIGPYHNSNNLKSIPTVSAAYRQMKISSNSSIPGKQKRYTSNIRRSKERKARNDSHSSTEELTESLLHNYDEEEGVVVVEEEEDDDGEEEVVLNESNHFRTKPYPDLVNEKRKEKKMTSSSLVESQQSTSKPKRRESEKLDNNNLQKMDEQISFQDKSEFNETQLPITSFEVEDPDQIEKNNQSKKFQFREKKKYYLSGTPLVGLYDRSRAQEVTNNKDDKNDTLASRWLQAQQPKHNEIFNQQDSLENYNVDRGDDFNSIQNNNSFQRQGRKGEEEKFETLLDKHFSHSTAVRHFNESMPVLVLPSRFSPETGKLIPSNPNERIKSVKNKPSSQSLQDAITNEEYTQSTPSVPPTTANTTSSSSKNKRRDSGSRQRQQQQDDKFQES